MRVWIRVQCQNEQSSELVCLKNRGVEERHTSSLGLPPLFFPSISNFSDLSQWRRKWQPTPVLLPGKSHGRRSPSHLLVSVFTLPPPWPFSSAPILLRVVMLMAPPLPDLLWVIRVTQLTASGITGQQGAGEVCGVMRSPQFTPRSYKVAHCTKRHHLLDVFHLQKYHHQVGDHIPDGQNQDTC